MKWIKTIMKVKKVKGKIIIGYYKIIIRCIKTNEIISQNKKYQGDI
jgi:hypothetical protein